jgi:hypothetical protein
MWDVACTVNMAMYSMQKAVQHANARRVHVKMSKHHSMVIFVVVVLIVVNAPQHINA